MRRGARAARRLLAAAIPAIGAYRKAAAKAALVLRPAALIPKCTRASSGKIAPLAELVRDIRACLQ
jgi:hypothetical protein